MSVVVMDFDLNASRNMVVAWAVASWGSGTGGVDGSRRGGNGARTGRAAAAAAARRAGWDDRVFAVKRGDASFVYPFP